MYDLLYNKYMMIIQIQNVYTGSDHDDDDDNIYVDDDDVYIC